MEVRHLDEVLAIEQRSFRTPWRREHFEHEIHENRFALNRVALALGRVVGYYSVWVLGEELQIHDIAVDPAWRRRRLARWMLDDMLGEARDRGCRRACLEVRESNAAARALYAESGFVEYGRRPGYYGAEGEDALLLELRLGSDGTV